MKFVIALFAVLPLLACVSCVNKEQPLPEIALWPNFSQAAITYTFDDNTPGQSLVALPLFDRYNFKATFYPVVDWMTDWTSFQEAALNGHEMGSHTVGHHNLSKLNHEDQYHELSTSKQILEKKFPQSSIFSIAYPYCVPPTAEDLTGRFYQAGRHCQGHIEKSTPDDFLQISSIMVGSEGELKTAADISAKSLEAAETQGWLVLLLHGVGNDGGFSPIDSVELEKSLQFFAQSRPNFWVATFSDVVRYIRERDNTKLNIRKIGRTAYELQMNSELENELYDLPLTLRWPLPKNWEAANLSQNEAVLSASVKVIDEQRFIEFNAVPGAGAITITKDKPASK